MMDKKRCMSCMRLIDGDAKICPHCGFQEEYYQVEFYHLPVGQTLQKGRYEIGRVIGEGGFGLTYIGWDGKFSQVVAIKEYYTKEMVSRDNTVSYKVRLYKQSDEERYQRDLKRVEREAKILKQFAGYPGIVRVEDFFEENNTIYIVMEYVEGRTLEQYRQQAGGHIQEDKCLSMFRQLLCSLHSVHKEKVVHRDISLANIMVRQDESLVLVDFGSARPFSQENEESKAMAEDPTVKLGYAPLEQYMPDQNNQGQWQDVYAISVCFYNCLTGKVLPDSRIRNKEDIWADVGGEIKLSKKIKNALKKGLELDYTERYRSVNELYEGLYGERLDATEEAPKSEASESGKGKGSDFSKTAVTDRISRWKKAIKKNKRQILAVFSVAVLVTAAAGGWWWYHKTSSDPVPETTESPNETNEDTETAPIVETTEKQETGTEEWTDQEGNHYIGIRKDGLLEGEGTCIYANGEIHTGQWVKGKPNGEGKREYTNGNRYEGEFKDGLREGTGTFYWTDGKRFEGEWKNDKRDGEGIFYAENGERYEGNYKDDVREGTGTYYYASGGRYEGEWANGIREGTGIFYYKSGNRFEGEWANDKPEGHGIFYWTNGNRYEGEWVKDKREGPGTFYYSEDGEYAGCRREGVYVNDKLHGEATFYWEDGTVVSEQWENGEKIREEEIQSD